MVGVGGVVWWFGLGWFGFCVGCVVVYWVFGCVVYCGVVVGIVLYG